MLCLLQPFSQRFMKGFLKIRLRHVCVAFIVIVFFDVFGAFTHIFELNYYDHFEYPYNGDIQPFVEALRHKGKPDVKPINEYNYSFIHGLEDKCADPDLATLRLVFLVKSAAHHFDRREGIRQSWGFPKRFYDVPTTTVFLLGVRPHNVELQAQIDAESDENNDILQADFIDSYYNNTIKTMLGFKWAVTHCRKAKFYMFVDDDMYVSVKNVLRFIRNPPFYPESVKEPNKRALHKREIKDSDWANETADPWPTTKEETNVNESNQSSPIRKISKRATAKEKIMMRRRPGWTSHNKTRMPMAKSSNEVNEDPETKLLNNKRKSLSYLIKLAENSTDSQKTLRREKRQFFELELPDDVRLFTGYVIVSAPHRHKTSKWYVPLSEYPYHLWPPYVTAGAYILSKEALLDMYYTSLYTQHFRFDDIFLGIVAKKADIEPFHCEEFHFYKKEYTRYNYKYVITSHGYDDPNEMQEVWNEQKSMGHA